MKKLRLFCQSDLKALFEKGKYGIEELNRKLDMVKTNPDLSDEEKSKNIDLINFALNGGVHHTRKDILEDIKSCEADIDDICSA